MLCHDRSDIFFFIKGRNFNPSLKCNILMLELTFLKMHDFSHELWEAGFGVKFALSLLALNLVGTRGHFLVGVKFCCYEWTFPCPT